MAAKVREAVAARRNPDFLIIARTNAMRASNIDDALRRGDAYRKAGADLLLLSKEMLATIDIEKLLAVERATVEKGKD